jgi:hypothetical protein
VSVFDLAIVAALIFGWGTLSARLERFDVTAPITFVLAGLLLTHGPLAVRGAAPSNELIKELAEFTLALVGSPTADRAVAVIAITVLLSVVAHGATAEPLAARYAKLLAIAQPVALVP